MKGLFWSLLATVVGVAMLGVGIVSVAGSFDGDKSSASEASADPSDFKDCPTDDPRFSEFKTLDLTGADGSASLFVSCQDKRIDVSMVAVDLQSEKARTVAMW